MIKKYSDKQIAFALFISSIILRSGYGFYTYFKDLYVEKNLYYELALEIISKRDIFYFTSDPNYDIIGPIMPWFYAFSIMVFGQNFLGIFLITAIASALITLYTYKTARLFLSKKTSFFAGVWSLIYFAYFYFIPSSSKDIWMAFFMIYLIYMLLKLFEQKQFTYIHYLLFIFMFVVSFHLDERYFIFAPLVFLYILLKETKLLKTFSIQKSLLFAGLVIVLLAPWTMRNYIKYDKIVLITTRTERLTDRIFGYESRENVLDQAHELENELYIYDYQIDSVVDGTKTVSDWGYEFSEAQRQFMLKGNLPMPFTKWEAFFSRLSAMFKPVQFGGTWERSGYFYYEKSFRQNMVSLLFYGTVLLFSIPGFYFLYRRNREAFFLFVSIIVVYGLIHALTIPYTNWRYRLPLDALFIIVGCFGMIKIAEKTGLKALIN